MYFGSQYPFQLAPQTNALITDFQDYYCALKQIQSQLLANIILRCFFFCTKQDCYYLASLATCPDPLGIALLYSWNSIRRYSNHGESGAVSKPGKIHEGDSPKNLIVRGEDVSHSPHSFANPSFTIDHSPVFKFSDYLIITLARTFKSRN